MELILDSCSTINNSQVPPGIWERRMALDLLYCLRFHKGWRPCVHLQLSLRAYDQEKFRLVVCIHREHPKVHVGAFSLPPIFGR